NWESSSLPAPGKAESLARTEDGGADFSLTTALTKGAPNTITLPETGPENLTEEEIYDYSETLLISEISPNPLGVDSLGDGEFIELFNRGSERVRLEGWRLDFGGRFVYEFPAGTSIANRSYLVLRSTAGFTLDNA